MSVIAKLVVREITDRGKQRVHVGDDQYEDMPVRVVQMYPVTGQTGEIDENKQFNRATPAGHVELTIINPLASEQFQVGDEFYATFDKASG